MIETKIKKIYKIIAFISLIIGVLTSTLVYSLQNGMHQTIPQAIGDNTHAMAVAISQLKYGLTGYRFYKKIRDTLHDNGLTSNPEFASKYGMTPKEVLTNANILNNAINLAINIDNERLKDHYSLLRQDLGMVTYYELSFSIFGYKVESLFYLYFLLMSVSISIFLITYHKRIDLLFILLLFVCSHYVVVAVAPLVGLQLQTVHNTRFLPVLGILPTLYLAQLGISKSKMTLLKVIGASVQALILMIVIHARTSALWQIMFLITAFGLTILVYWFIKPGLGKYVINKVSLWVLGVVFLCLVLLKMHTLFWVHYSYDNATSTHLFWHSMYEGLGAHPDSMNKYDIFYGDVSSFQIVRKRTKQQFGTDNWQSLGGYELFESILKSEYTRILVNDPRFVVESYLYKFLLFFKNYFSRKYGAIYFIFSLPTLLAVILGSILAGEIFLKQLPSYFVLMILGTLFSLLPTMIDMPRPYLISDPSLMVTFMIYMIISFVICYVVQRYREQRIS